MVHHDALELRLRRGFGVSGIWVSEERRLLVAYRLPGARARHFSIG